MKPKEYPGRLRVIFEGVGGGWMNFNISTSKERMSYISFGYWDDPIDDFKEWLEDLALGKDNYFEFQGGIFYFDKSTDCFYIPECYLREKCKMGLLNEKDKIVRISRWTLVEEFYNAFRCFIFSEDYNTDGWERWVKYKYKLEDFQSDIIDEYLFTNPSYKAPLLLKKDELIQRIQIDISYILSISNLKSELIKLSFDAPKNKKKSYNRAPAKKAPVKNKQVI